MLSPTRFKFVRDTEVFFRRAWMRAITRRLARRPQVRRLDDDDRPARLLYIRLEGIGDVIMGTALVRALKAARPNLTIDVLTTPAAAPVLDHNPRVNEVMALAKRRWTSYPALVRRLRGNGYDIVIDGRFQSPGAIATVPFLMLAAGAPCRIGVPGGAQARDVYTIPLPPPAGDGQFGELQGALLEPFGIDGGVVDWRGELFFTDAELARAAAVWDGSVGDARANGAGDNGTRDNGTRDNGARANGARPRRLLVNLSASEWQRRWPDERFVAAIRRVRAQEPTLRVVVIGAPREWESVQRVAAESDATPAPTKLREALALVATSDVVFTPDTSISHAASACRKPAVVMLPAYTPAFAPYRTAGRVLTYEGPTMASLTLAEVVEALEETLRGTRGEGRGVREGAALPLTL